MKCYLQGESTHSKESHMLEIMNKGNISEVLERLALLQERNLNLEVLSERFSEACTQTNASNNSRILFLDCFTILDSQSPLHCLFQVYFFLRQVSSE